MASQIVTGTNTDKMLFHATQVDTASTTEDFSLSNQFALPEQSAPDGGKMTVALDVDETMVHAEFLSEAQTKALTPDKLALLNKTIRPHAFAFVFKGRAAIVKKRPFLSEFLTIAAQTFELVAFTAAEEDYAQIVLAEIDPQGAFFRHKLFRQHCALEGHIKDLRVINRPLERTVLVDNSHTSFYMQPSNGIPIESFTNNMSDKALITLMDFLNLLNMQRDVRMLLSSVFQMEARVLSMVQMASTQHHW